MRIFYSQRDRGLLSASLEDFKEKLDERLSPYPYGGEQLELPQTIKKAVRDGLSELNITDVHNAETDFVFAELLQEKKAQIICPQCEHTISPADISLENWKDLAPPEANASAWGREFKCPKGHSIFVAFDEIT